MGIRTVEAKGRTASKTEIKANVKARQQAAINTHEPERPRASFDIVTLVVNMYVESSRLTSVVVFTRTAIISRRSAIFT